MIDKTYLKKVIVSDENASAEARGARLRKIRNLANLTRKDLCDTDELKLHTYKGWELARFGGLPIDGAAKIVKRVAKENVICTVEWLLYGKGQEPYILPKPIHYFPLNNDELILREISFLQSLYPDVIYTKISDNSFAPHYLLGDYVAGIKCKINSIKNQPYLVELDSGNIVLSYLQWSGDKLGFELQSYGEDNYISMAPIIRHYQQFKIED